MGGTWLLLLWIPMCVLPPARLSFLFLASERALGMGAFHTLNPGSAVHVAEFCGEGRLPSLGSVLKSDLAEGREVSWRQDLALGAGLPCLAHGLQMGL